jgi:hypothetical protein
LIQQPDPVPLLLQLSFAWGPRTTIAFILEEVDSVKRYDLVHTLADTLGVWFPSHMTYGSEPKFWWARQPTVEQWCVARIQAYLRLVSLDSLPDGMCNAFLTAHMHTPWNQFPSTFVKKALSPHWVAKFLLETLKTMHSLDFVNESYFNTVFQLNHPNWKNELVTQFILHGKTVPFLLLKDWASTEVGVEEKLKTSQKNHVNLWHCLLVFDIKMELSDLSDHDRELIFHHVLSERIRDKERLEFPTQFYAEIVSKVSWTNSFVQRSLAKLYHRFGSKMVELGSWFRRMYDQYVLVPQPFLGLSGSFFYRLIQPKASSEITTNHKRKIDVPEYTCSWKFPMTELPWIYEACSHLCTSEQMALLVAQLEKSDQAIAFTNFLKSREQNKFS